MKANITIEIKEAENKQELRKLLRQLLKFGEGSLVDYRIVNFDLDINEPKQDNNNDKK